MGQDRNIPSVVAADDNSRPYHQLIDLLCRQTKLLSSPIEPPPTNHKKPRGSRLTG
jgi:hypothetical protein